MTFPQALGSGLQALLWGTLWAAPAPRSKPECKRNALTSRVRNPFPGAKLSESLAGPPRVPAAPLPSVGPARARSLRSPESGARRHFRPRWRRHPISAREAGGVGSLASRRRQRPAPGC